MFELLQDSNSNGNWLRRMKAKQSIEENVFIRRWFYDETLWMAFLCAIIEIGSNVTAIFYVVIKTKSIRFKKSSVSLFRRSCKENYWDVLISNFIGHVHLGCVAFFFTSLHFGIYFFFFVLFSVSASSVSTRHIAGNSRITNSNILIWMTVEDRMNRIERREKKNCTPWTLNTEHLNIEYIQL